MARAQTSDPRHATAERNVEAILDGAERLLRHGRQPTISAVASEARVSRVTVYAHFEDRATLLEALVERTVRRAMSAVESAEPDRGPAVEALRRVVAASWEQLAHNMAIGRASAAELSADAMRRAHQPARAVLQRLVERGRQEETVRVDVPVDWLVTSALALIHAAAEEVRAGELDAGAALDALLLTVVDLLAGRRG
jgi:AcrR family transcriptional regulator